MTEKKNDTLDPSTPDYYQETYPEQVIEQVEKEHSGSKASASSDMAFCDD